MNVHSYLNWHFSLLQCLHILLCNHCYHSQVIENLNQNTNLQHIDLSDNIICCLGDIRALTKLKVWHAFDSYLVHFNDRDLSLRKSKDVSDGRHQHSVFDNWRVCMWQWLPVVAFCVTFQVFSRSIFFKFAFNEFLNFWMPSKAGVLFCLNSSWKPNGIMVYV